MKASSVGFRLLVAAVVPASCEFPAEETVGEHSVQLVVYGTVRDTLGQPFPGVKVEARAHRDNDCGKDGGLTGNTVSTGTGHYRIFLASWGNTYTACVQVRPQPDSFPPRVPARVSGVLLRQNSPLDSTRVDIEVKPGPYAPD
jgi:hypothetical protein